MPKRYRSGGGFSRNVRRRYRNSGSSRKFKYVRARRGRVARVGAFVTEKSYTVPGTIILPAGSSAAYASKTFTLSDMPGYADYKNIFDSYRIVSATLYARLIQVPEATNEPNVTPAVASASNYYVDFYCTVDHNDATIPSSIS